jgi:hypothetical protein
LAKLCNIGLANSWQLITFPNLPQWTASGSFPLLPGSAAYYLNIVLAAGSSVPANDTWQNTTAFGAVGISNFVTGISNTFDLGFVQHEPGPLCSTPMDKPWTQNYDECLRYFAKSYDYNTPINTVTDDGCIYGVVPTSNLQTAPTRVSFPKPLAIKPTALNAYSTHGGVNAAWDFSAGANKAVTAISAYSEKSFSQITISAASTAGAVLAYHYVADTGW